MHAAVKHLLEIRGEAVKEYADFLERPAAAVPEGPMKDAIQDARKTAEATLRTTTDLSAERAAKIVREASIDEALNSLYAGLHGVIFDDVRKAADTVAELTNVGEGGGPDGEGSGYRLGIALAAAGKAAGNMISEDDRKLYGANFKNATFPFVLKTQMIELVTTLHKFATDLTNLWKPPTELEGCAKVPAGQGCKGPAVDALKFTAVLADRCTRATHAAIGFYFAEKIDEEGTMKHVAPSEASRMAEVAITAALVCRDATCTRAVATDLIDAINNLGAKAPTRKEGATEPAKKAKVKHEFPDGPEQEPRKRARKARAAQRPRVAKAKQGARKGKASAEQRMMGTQQQAGNEEIADSQSAQAPVDTEPEARAESAKEEETPGDAVGLEEGVQGDHNPQHAEKAGDKDSESTRSEVQAAAGRNFAPKTGATKPAAGSENETDGAKTARFTGPSRTAYENPDQEGPGAAEVGQQRDNARTTDVEHAGDTGDVPQKPPKVDPQEHTSKKAAWTTPKKRGRDPPAQDARETNAKSPKINSAHAEPEVHAAKAAQNIAAETEPDSRSNEPPAAGREKNAGEDIPGDVAEGAHANTQPPKSASDESRDERARESEGQKARHGAARTRPDAHLKSCDDDCEAQRAGNGGATARAPPVAGGADVANQRTDTSGAAEDAAQDATKAKGANAPRARTAPGADDADEFFDDLIRVKKEMAHDNERVMTANKALYRRLWGVATQTMEVMKTLPLNNPVIPVDVMNVFVVRGFNPTNVWRSSPPSETIRKWANWAAKGIQTALIHLDTVQDHRMFESDPHFFAGLAYGDRAAGDVERANPFRGAKPQKKAPSEETLRIFGEVRALRPPRPIPDGQTWPGERGPPKTGDFPAIMKTTSTLLRFCRIAGVSRIIGFPQLTGRTEISPDDNQYSERLIALPPGKHQGSAHASIFSNFGDPSRICAVMPSWPEEERQHRQRFADSLADQLKEIEEAQWPKLCSAFRTARWASIEHDLCTLCTRVAEVYFTPPAQRNKTFKIRMTDIMEKHDDEYFKSFASTLKHMHYDVAPKNPNVGELCLIPRDLADAAIRCAYVLRGDVTATRDFANAIKRVSTMHLVSTMLDAASDSRAGEGNDSDSESNEDTAAARVADIREANAP